MSTSLAEQLQRLAVPQTTILKRDKKRASLLFDPKEAAGIKRQTIYQIGLEGLEELVSKNEIFSEFNNSLFHITSRDFERSVQDSEANKKLDKTIKKFLVLLSPYFLLNCSHKALEWLINRYSINEYNREDLLMLILPYHESNIFVRVLQLLEFKDSSDSFYFLKVLQKRGVHLPKQSLLQHAASNSGFLKFVTKYISLLLKMHEQPNILSVAFNFYCSVFAGAIEYSEAVKEDQVSQMLPLILKGLNSPIPDFCAASYVITARLVLKSNILDKLLDKFLEKLSGINVKGLQIEMCLVLTILYETQTHYHDMPATAVATLSEKEWLPKTLQELNNSGSHILPLLEVLVKRCTEEGTRNDTALARNLVKNCLVEIKLQDSYVPNILHSILDSVNSKKKWSEEITNWLIELMQMLERQYPNAFDQEIIKILSTAGDKKTLKKKNLLSKIIKDTMAYKGNFDVFEKLYHPNPEIRSEAITYLRENYNSLRETSKETIKQSLLDRLNDDHVEVIEETLHMIQEISILGKNELKDVLKNLTRKMYKNENIRNRISPFIIQLLNTINDPKDWALFLSIFPFLMPKTSEELEFSKKLISCPCISESILLKPFIEKLEVIEKETDFIEIVVESLQSSNSRDNVKEFLEVLQKVPNDQRDVLHKYVASLILTSILPNESPVDMTSPVLEIVITYYETVDVKFKDSQSNLLDYIGQAIQNKFPVEGYLKCLENLIYKTSKQELHLSSINFSEDSPAAKYFVLLANILVTKRNEKIAMVFLDHFCTDWQTKFTFLLNLCLSGNKNFHPFFKKNVLHYLRKVSNMVVKEFKQFINIDKPITAYLLLLLADPFEDVRKLTFEIIGSLIDGASRKSNSYFYLLEGLRKHKEEIVIDPEQVSLIMFNILDPSNTGGKKHVTDLNSICKTLVKLVSDETSPIYLKAGLINLLSHINTFDILEQIVHIALESLQENQQKIDGFKAIIFNKVIFRIEEKIANKILLNTNTWKFIECALKDSKTVIAEGEKEICPAVRVMNQMDREFFMELEEQIIKRLLDIIVEVSCVAENPEVLPSAGRIFKHIDLNANLILDQLIKMRDIQSPRTDTKKIKRRVNVVPTVDILGTLEWQKGVCVLEFIQNKKKIQDMNVLLPALFDILKKCLDFDEQTAVEYAKQLVLSSILHCCLKMGDQQSLPENVFNMELIVQCIRASQNPQTHHHALLLLAHTAAFLPSQVLHHMMAIFTFMGSSVLRHDDAYSFQIITKIIDTIIPILVKDDHITTIAQVLRVFVDALLDVPEHRRIPLYKQLLSKINVQENLYLFLLLVFESQVLHSNQEKQRSENNPKKLEIAANLCLEFAPDTVLHNCIKLIKHVNELPDEKEDGMETDAENYTFNIITHSPKDFRHYKYLILKFTANLLASQEFVKQIAVLPNEDEVRLEDIYKEIIVNILRYIQRTSVVAEKAADTPQAQYWKIILHHSYDTLDSLNALVTPQMFILITKGLMVHTLSTVRRRILELLNNKLQYNPQFFSECNKTEIYSLIPPIINIIEGINDEVDSEQEIIIQTALLSLKLLVKSLAPKEPQKFVKILDFITNIIKSGKAKGNVLASVILCLAELCVTIKAHAIAGLAEFMPAIIKILKQKKNENPGVLMKSVITTIEKIFMSMPLFLSPYLEKLLFELSVLINNWGYSSDDQKLQPFINKLNSIKQKIGAVLPHRVLIPAVEECYKKLIEKKYFSAVSALMDILAESLSNLKGFEINSNLPELTNFFLNALKFRADGSFSLDEANIVEEHIIQSLTVLILKLSESTFRPLYYKLFDWAVRNDEKNERIITFYNLSSGFAKSLKGLFVLFAGHFLNNAAQILDSCNKTKTEELYFSEESKNMLLLEYVLKTLNAVFLHGSQRFINKDRFEVLMQPLVDQLENTLGGVENLQQRNEELLTPCLVNFSLATSDDSLWKQMNYQILLKMRHNVPKVRLIALHCLTEIVKKLGEDFLSLLPETIPFLAELLEDEEEDVEKACQKAVQEMEKVLGEPLQKYF